MNNMFTIRIGLDELLGYNIGLNNDDVNWIKRKCIENKGNFQLFKEYFMEACGVGSIKIVKYYLERCVMNINGSLEEYAFQIACERGNLHIATLLVNYGFQSNCHNWSKTGKFVKHLADKDVEDLNKLYLILTKEGYGYTYPIQTRNGIRCIKIVKYGRCRSEKMELYF